MDLCYFQNKQLKYIHFKYINKHTHKINERQISNGNDIDDAIVDFLIRYHTYIQILLYSHIHKADQQFNIDRQIMLR